MSKEINLFEVATREKYRFPYKGMISVEDLWDLTLSGLDSIFKILNKQVKQSQEESLLDVKTKDDEMLDNQIAIVKFIVDVKQKENADRMAARDKKEQRQKLQAILHEKQESELKSKSAEEIEAMLKALED